MKLSKAIQMSILSNFEQLTNKWMIGKALKYSGALSLLERIIRCLLYKNACELRKWDEIIYKWDDKNLEERSCGRM